MMLNSFQCQQLSCRTNLVEGKALGILGWVWGQLGGELSPHHTLKVSVPLTHPWDDILQAWE